MFPALTFTTRPRPRRRVVLGVVGAATILVSVIAAAQAAPATSSSATAATLLRDRLAPSTWALALPLSWLAAPLPATGEDRIDLIAVRTGDRPLAIPIAADLRVVSIDEAAVVFEVDEDSAAAIATARASSLLLVPLLRSKR